MKHFPVLKNVYTRIDILNLNESTKTFSKTASIYLLGDASKHVKEIKQLTPKNKDLSAIIGVDGIKALSKSCYVTGGSGPNEEWDELNEMDIDDLLSTDVSPIAESPDTKKSVITGDHFSDLVLYTKDKIADVRDKIAITSGIEPYKQYLWAPNAHMSLDGGEISLMSYWATAMRTIDGYPIDAYQVNDSMSRYTIESFTDESTLVLYCVSMDSIIGNRSKLHTIARSDTESFNMIYANTFNRFFPMLPIPAFIQYLVDDASLYRSFPSLIFNGSDIRDRYASLSKLIPVLNKESPILIDSDTLTVSTTGIVLHKSYSSMEIRVNTALLFQMIDITSIPSIAKIDLYRYDANRTAVRLRKINQLDHFRGTKDDPSFVDGLQSRFKLVRARAILITLLPSDEYDFLTIIIDRYGSIWIKARPNQLLSFSKAMFISIVSPLIDPIIQSINGCTAAFTTVDRFSLLGGSACEYSVPSSSSKITFKRSMACNKLLDAIASKLIPAGIMDPYVNDWTRRQKITTYYSARYGIERISDAVDRHKLIEVKDIGGSAVISLTNLDIDETNLYVDIIGRLITGSGAALNISDGSRILTVADPVLFRSNGTTDTYSRICQKKFQPVLTTKSDPDGVKYTNYTFERDEYYKCPSKAAPILGFLQGKHDKGHCLPCCRKSNQPESVLKTCLGEGHAVEEKLSVRSTYKIEYPISDIPNIKIMDRRITMPDYIIQLFGISGLIANGAIMESHADIRDGSNSAVKSFLQTAVMISAIQVTSGVATYASYRAFLLNVISAIKQPMLQSGIMGHRSISERFTTPQELIHSIEDRFIKMTVLETSDTMSEMEWNDLMVFLGNKMGLNILLLADDRSSGANPIQMMNIDDVDTNRPVAIFLRRINTEWSIANHSTRAVYLPVTTSGFRVMAKSPLTIERINITHALSKVKRVVRGSRSRVMDKQITIEKIQMAIKGSKLYRVISDMSDQKVVVIGIGKTALVSTIATTNITIYPKDIEISPTASFTGLLQLVVDYNEYFLNTQIATRGKRIIDAYNTYLHASLKISDKYEFIDSGAFLLKIKQCIIYSKMVIGVLVESVDINRTVSSELMFIAPTPRKTIETELNRCNKELKALHSRVQGKSIICYPTAVRRVEGEFSADVSFISWDINPLKSSIANRSICKHDMADAFNRGMYMSEIYNIFAQDIIDAWSLNRPNDLIDYINTCLKKTSPPYVNTSIDTLADDLAKNFKHYDPAIMRVVLLQVVEQINAFDKDSKAAIMRVTEHVDFDKFELKNIHRRARVEIKRIVESFAKDVCIKSGAYPTFDLDTPILNQRNLFYRQSDMKLMIHDSLYSDLVDMLVSDLSNPFRRGYIINSRLVESMVTDVSPHKGELIYIHRVEI
jgi:hypothetical protein